MNRLALLIAAVLLAALSGVAAAQGDGRPDPLAALKAGGVPGMKAFEAGDELVKQAQAQARALEIVPALNALLNENEVFVRLNVAIALAKIALQGPAGDDVAKALHVSLTKCWHDSAAGVRYWGLSGLLAPKMAPLIDIEATLRAGLDPQKQPLPINTVAADAAVKGKVTALAPTLLAVLKHHLPVYKKARIKLLTPTTPQTGVEGMAPGMAPGMEGPPAPGVGGMGPGLGPAAARPAAGAATGQLINPEQLDRKQLQDLAEKFDEEDAIVAMRYLGWQMENLVEQRWGFKQALPWDLEGCLSRAEGWFQTNKAKFPAPPPAEPT